MLLGHSQYLQTPLIQIVAFTGVYGLTFLIVLTNATISELVVYFSTRSSQPRSPLGMFKKAPVMPLMVTCCFLLSAYLYGALHLSEGGPGKSLSVGVVQGNVAGQHQWWNRKYQQTMIDRYARLTLEATQEAPKLIVWPETAVPGDVRNSPFLAKQLGQLAITTETHLLVGSSEYAKFSDKNKNLIGKYYNSVFLFSPQGTLEGEYRKIKLLPFGEYVPLEEFIIWPNALVAAMGDILPGNQYTIFRIGQISFGTLLCWEIIFPDLFREFVKRGASFMVNPSNESWFGRSAAPSQFLAMSVFRAAENQVAIVRAATTGISAFIDPFGHITSRFHTPDGEELFVEGVLVAEVPLATGMTFYTLYGDVFAWAVMALCGVFFVFAVLPMGRISSLVSKTYSAFADKS